jgi:integrase
MDRPLTAKGIESLRPRSAAYELSDGGTGLRLRVTPSGLRVWRWHYRPAAGAAQKVLTLGYHPAMGLAAARNRLDELQAARREERINEVLGGGADAPKTVADLAERFYTLRILPHRRRPEVVRDVLDRDVLPRIGTRKLGGFTTAACRSVVEAVIERGATTHAGRVLQILKQLGRFGVGNAHLQTNPAEPLEAQQLGVVADSSDRWLTADEIVAWWRAIDASEMTPATRLGLRILLLTGVRTGELLKARWVNVDLEADTWVIPIEDLKLTKKAMRKARPFEVPLAPAAKDMFLALRDLAGPSPWVMASDGDSASGHLNDTTLVRAMGRLWSLRRSNDGTWKPLLSMPRATAHDLRRTMRTHYEKTLGVEPHVAERALGHSLGRILDVYAKGEYLPARRDAALRWADYVTRIVRGEDARVLGIGSAR